MAQEIFERGIDFWLTGFISTIISIVLEIMIFLVGLLDFKKKAPLFVTTVMNYSLVSIATTVIIGFLVIALLVTYRSNIFYIQYAPTPPKYYEVKTRREIPDAHEP